MSVHDAIKRRKLGYGRVRDHLCREIRFGRIGREDALSLEVAYNRNFNVTEKDNGLRQLFFTWLGMNAQAFEWLLDYHYGLVDRESSSPPSPPNAAHSEFLQSYSRNGPPTSTDDAYILIGKGLEV
jgi:hypothetical protein